MEYKNFLRFLLCLILGISLMACHTSISSAPAVSPDSNGTNTEVPGTDQEPGDNPDTEVPGTDQDPGDNPDTEVPGTDQDPGNTISGMYE